MFFVLSINTRNQTAKIVGHADDLEGAIKEVKRCSRDYVLIKSEPILHHEKDTQTPQIPRLNYYTRNSDANVHHVEVYRQRTEEVSYWGLVKAEKPQPSELIRRFMYTQYDAQLSNVVPLPPPPPPVLKHSDIAVAKPTVLPTGGFPCSIIEDLIQSQKFKTYRQSTEQNSKTPKKTPNHIIFASDDESEY